jgi:hypothetical protein
MLSEMFINGNGILLLFSVHMVRTAVTSDYEQRHSQEEGHCLKIRELMVS